MRLLRGLALVGVLGGAVVFASACGGDENGTTPTSPDGAAPVVLPDGAVVIPGVDSGGVPFEGGPGGSGCGGRAADPAAAAIVEGYLDKAPSAPSDPTLREEIVEAVLRSCESFGPSPATNTGWKREHCWAHLLASMSKESGYDPKVSVKDTYGSRAIGNQRANDPVVGLLQVRFSSTVHEMVALGNTDRLACVGCPIPDAVKAHAAEGGSTPYWAVTGPTENMSLLQNAACNVGMGAWFYYVHATGNGKASAVTYPDAYCKGEGTGGNLITGLLSHLKGSEGGKGIVANQGALDALRNTDSGAFNYVTQIKGLFETMAGPPAGGSPFFVKLAPDTTMYCQ